MIPGSGRSPPTPAPSSPSPSPPPPCPLDLEAYQSLHVTVGSSGTMALLPQPLTCFKGAHFTQRQEFHLAADGSSSLVVVDWVTSGRMGRGEKWEFRYLCQRNEV